MRPQNPRPHVRFHLTWTWRPAGKSQGANKWRCLCSPQSFEVNRRKVQGNGALTPQSCSYVLLKCIIINSICIGISLILKITLYIVILKPGDTVGKLGFMFVL